MSRVPKSGALRITQVVTTNAFAGTERYVIDVSTELARRGHGVDVVGGQPEAMQRLLTGTSVRWRTGADPQRALVELVRGGRRDIVHSHITKADFVAAAAHPLTGGALVSTRHITARRGYSDKAARLALLVRRMQAVEIAVSDFVASAVETPVDEVLLNGVNPMPVSDRPRQRTVLVAQRLSEEKQTGLALQAWARSGLGAQGWTLVIAGQGEQSGELTTLAAELAIAQSVEFAGWIDDLPQRMDDAAILLATAPEEPCGLTVLEAMAHGLPVVAAGAGGHLETVGRDGDAALFAPGDAAAAADQLVRLAQDETRRQDYGHRLRTLQRDRFTISAHVDELERIYRAA